MSMQPRRRPALFALMMLLSAGATAPAQDFYDPTVLRTVNLQFHDANWLTLLQQNYASETLILADMTVDGVTYPDVGVRIRGNTSYTALPAGSQKFSLAVDVNFVHENQELMGYDALNFNNGFRDPTFCREVVYNNIVAQFIPNPRANHVVVTLNGANWGVYVNVQQADKRMFRDYFANADGLRIACPNNPNGPGLRYNGATQSGYTAYQISNDGGLSDPWTPLIQLCNSVTNEPLATWQNIDTKLAIDPSIWSVVLENLYTDDDSYVNKGADFMVYRDPLDARFHLLQRDANETFTQVAWSPTLNFTNINRPVLSRVLSVAENRQRYLSHYRHALASFNWATLEPIFTAHRNLISAAVQADPKKLYSHTLFLNNFTSTVNLPYTGLAGGSIVGLQQFVTQRSANLAANAELVAPGPVIQSVSASSSNPAPGSTVTISADVAPSGSPVSKVELFYRPTPNAGYQRVLMTNQGGTLYSAALPVTGLPGQRVSYYVAATSGNTFQSLTFSPALSERGPLSVEYALGSAPGMRITEWMYSGVHGEFIEFTNMSSNPIDLTGWSMDDDRALPGGFPIGAFGVVQPGESVVVTENAAAAFRAAWGLDPGVKVIGQLGAGGVGNNFGRSDQIHLFDASGTLIDRLYYGDQTYPGSIRTQNASGQTCVEWLGQNAVIQWQLAAVGDVYGSTASVVPGDIGTPGRYQRRSCNPCPADVNASGTIDTADLAVFLGAFGTAVPPFSGGDVNGDGLVNTSDLTQFLSLFGQTCP